MYFKACLSILKLHPEYSRNEKLSKYTVDEKSQISYCWRKKLHTWSGGKLGYTLWC